MLAPVTYEARDVQCPHCGRTRSTKAPGGVRISCPGCGRTYMAPKLSPATTPSTQEPEANAAGPVTQAPPADTAAAPSALSQGAAVVVIDTAPMGVVDVDDDAVGELVDVELPPAPAIARAPMDPPPTHPMTEVGRDNGRKGGQGRATAAATYAARKQRRRG